MLGLWYSCIQKKKGLIVLNKVRVAREVIVIYNAIACEL